MSLLTLEKPPAEPAARRASLTVEWVTTGAAFRALEPAWRELAARDPAATVFQSWEWNAAWWEAFGAGRGLRLGVARAGERLVGIAPLVVRRLGPARVLEFLGAGRTDYLRFLLDEDHS